MAGHRPHSQSSVQVSGTIHADILAILLPPVVRSVPLWACYGATSSWAVRTRPVVWASSRMTGGERGPANDQVCLPEGDRPDPSGRAARTGDEHRHQGAEASGGL